MKELWKPVIGFEDCYEVSSSGVVKTTSRRPGQQHEIGYVMKQGKKKDGYITVNLSRNNKHKRLTVHRIVMAAFVGPCPEGMEVNHKDGNKANNCLENLEYMTRQQNVHHAYDVLHRKSPFDNRGEKHGLSKFTETQVIEIRRLYATGEHTHRSLAKMFGCDHRAIGMIVNRQRWSHI